MANNKVGENALESTVRRLGVFNTRFADADVEGMEDFVLSINKNGSGSVRYPEGADMFIFRDLDQLGRFLSASHARQVQMMVTC